jgi:TPR repeat protein
MSAGGVAAAASSSASQGNHAPDQGAPRETVASRDVANAGPTVSSPSNAATLGSSEPSAMIGIAMARGDEAFARGDVISARQFYELAASIGLAQAATAVGSTYDPNFLTARDIRGKFTDTEAAEQWYQKGIAGGDAEARLRLDKLLKVAKDSR